MTQNLQQKNEQLRALCKKQQAQIAKLQGQIRQRYQSFYLHSSRYKKGQGNSSELNQSTQRPTKSISEVPKVHERLYSQRPPQKSKTEIIEEYLSTKSLGLVVRNQYEFLIEPTKQERNKELNEMAITIQSFKSRIAALQANKNESVKQLEKSSNQIQQLKAKISVLEKNIGLLTKSQKKLKDKLKKLPEYEEKIDEIYIKLMKEVKKQEFNEQDQSQKHFNHKMQEIIKWISQSKQKVDSLLEGFNEIESQQNQVHIEAPLHQPIKPLQTASIILPTSENVQEEKLQTITSPEFSPMKTSSKIIPQNWTIISKINEVDIRPFDTSEVKSYNFPNETSNRKQEEQSIIKVLQQNSMIEQQLNQTKKEIGELKQELHMNRSKSSKLAQQMKNSLLESNKYKEELDDKLKDLLKDLQESRRKNEVLQQQLNMNSAQMNRLKDQLNQERMNKNKLKQEFESNPKLSELQYSRLTKQVQTLKELHQKSKLNITQPDLATSKMTVNQQLQPPYFVEEDLQTNPNDEYVKRSFIRKKIVRRNLSATTYRIVSKSKQEVQQIVSNKINDYRDISREKADKLKASAKRDKAGKEEALQSSVNRISEVSEPRDSGINSEEVRILQVITTTPGQEIRSAKIYSKGGQSNLSTRRKY